MYAYYINNLKYCFINIMRSRAEVAYQAHNLRVAGSNPACATNKTQ